MLGTVELISRLDISSIAHVIALMWMPRRHLCLVNIGSGNGLVPPGSRPLPEPVLAKFSDAI